ncbi:MAG: helix-turn-helix transcriptional regulator [Actinocatenispora sp.]
MPRRPPGVRARGLGAELKECRAQTRLSVRAVAERLGWTHSTVNRIENGKRKTSIEEVAALLVVYDIKGDERDRLLALTKDVDQPGWWETGDTPGLPSQLTALIGFESTATRILDFGTVLVPGLLQTAEYTRAMMVAAGAPPNQAETMVAMRLGRQGVLTRTDHPEYLAIIDEAVLRRPIGGPSVMAEQVRRIAKESSRANVTVQVVPFSVGAHTGLDGPCVILQFAKARTVVHLEHKRSGIFIDDPEVVKPFLDATVTLQRVALTPDESREFLTTVAAEFEQQE